MCGPAPSATVVSRSMNYKRAPRDQSALAGNVGTGGAFQRYRAGGIRMSTFLCSLRPDPAPLRFWVGSAGSGAPFAGKLERGGAFALRARGEVDRFQCSLRPDPAPLRFWLGSAGSVRARRERWDRRGFPALSRWGDQDVDVPMLAADRSRSAAVFGGSAGPGAPLAGKLERGGTVALCSGQGSEEQSADGVVVAHHGGGVLQLLGW